MSSKLESNPPEQDIGKLELADIVDASAIQSLMDDFYQLARIPMAVVDAEGRMLVGVGWQEICTQFHRVHPESRRHCIESDIELSAGILKASHASTSARIRCGTSPRRS